MIFEIFSRNAFTFMLYKCLPTHVYVHVDVHVVYYDHVHVHVHCGDLSTIMATNYVNELLSPLIIITYLVIPTVVSIP